MRFHRVILNSLVTCFPDEVWSSEAIEERLAPAYGRARLQPGRIELMTGIRERRIWPQGTLPSQASTAAVRRLLDASSVATESIDVLMHTAVCRDRLEPATAATVHAGVGLGPACQIFDISNACLGFLNGILVGAAMIESGQAERVLIAAGENGRPLLEQTVSELNAREDLDRRSIKPYFANLTIGCGAVAGLLCREDLARGKGGYRLHGGVCETDTSFAGLCEGDTTGDGLMMATDSEELLVAGLQVASRAWNRFTANARSQSFQRVITHQVGRAHQRELFRALHLDPRLDFATFPTLGNVGSVSCPGTLALAAGAGAVVPGNNVALLGIGSGLSSIMLEVEAL